MYEVIQDIRQLFSNPLATVFVLVVSCNLFGGIGGVPSAAISAIGIFVTLFIFMRGANVDFSMLAFMLYLPVEILLSQPDSRFHSWERAGLFIAMTASVSPLLQSEYARIFRLRALQLFTFIIVVASVGSFFCYFLGINMMFFGGSNEYLGSAGRFSGLFDHSMKLGPMAALASLFLIYKGFTTQKKWLFAIAALCACTVLFSASRGSFVGLVVGCFFLLYRYSGNKEQLMKICVTVIAVLIVTYPLWNGAMEGLEKKQAGNIEAGGTLSSRSAKWESRIDEFISSPIWGVGFSAINPNGSDYWNKSKGTIEPGTSWLAILSMTGAVGFMLFMSIFRKAYMLVKNSMNNRAIILYTFLIFFSVHLLVEGYIFAAGNPLCIIFWLLLACCCDMEYEDVEYDDNDNIFSL